MASHLSRGTMLRFPRGFFSFWWKHDWILLIWFVSDADLKCRSKWQLNTEHMDPYKPVVFWRPLVFSTSRVSCNNFILETILPWKQWISIITTITAAAVKAMFKPVNAKRYLVTSFTPGMPWWSGNKCEGVKYHETCFKHLPGTVHCDFWNSDIHLVRWSEISVVFRSKYWTCDRPRRWHSPALAHVKKYIV